MKRERSRTFFRISFQAKILLPVIAVLIALPALMVGLVSNYIQTEALSEAHRTLTTADSVFLNSLRIKERLLLDRFMNLGNEPRTKAVASLHDKDTMAGFLDDLIYTSDDEVELMLYSPISGNWHSGACQESSSALENFQQLISQKNHVVEEEFSVDIAVFEERPYYVISVPVRGVSDSFALGVLTIGMPIGDDELAEHKSLSKTDVLLVSDGEPISGTLSSGRSSEFLKLFGNEGWKNGTIFSAEIEEESLYCLSGTIQSEMFGSLDYVLLSSYEERLQALRHASVLLWGLSALGALFSVSIIWVLIKKITHPLRLLRDGAELVGRGDFSQRVECNSQDECGDLAEAFNKMTSNLKKSHSDLEKTVDELQNAQEELLLREARLRESEEGLHLIIEGARDHVIFTIDDNNKILRWNAAAQRILGYSVSEAQGMEYSNLFDGAGIDEEILDTVRQKGQIGFEGWRKRKDGTLFWAAVTISRIERLEGSEGGGYVEIARDVSARKEAEVAMQEAKDAAESSNRAKSEFLANMSHEVRTPMNGIIGMTSLLSELSMTNEQRDYVDTIKISADSLLIIIDDILDISKIESGKLEITIAPVALVELVEEVAMMFEATCLDKNISLSIVVENRVPREVDSDADRLRRTLVNLVDNAVKFTESGGVLITLGIDENEKICIKVEDTGIGIADERIENLFKPFFQAESSFSRQYGGTGLGLAISKNIAKLLGGDVSVSSEVGKGSIFTLKFVAKELASETRFFDLKGEKILVISDDTCASEALSKQLSYWNGDVATVSFLPNLILDFLKKDPRKLVFVERTAVRQDTLKCLDEFKKNNEDVLILSQCASDSAEVENLDKNGWEKTGWPCYPLAFNKTLCDLLGCEKEKAKLLKIGKNDKPSVSKKKKADAEFASKFPLKILVVEDNVINLKVLNKILSILGYETDQAENGQIAVEAAESKPYDFIFMDLQMPVMDGFDASRKILASEKVINPVYISAFTANARQEDVDACHEIGMHDFGSKPARVASIKELLERGYEWHLAANKVS